VSGDEDDDDDEEEESEAGAYTQPLLNST